MSKSRQKKKQKRNDMADCRNEIFPFSFAFHMIENKSYARNLKSILFPRKAILQKKKQRKSNLYV